MRSSILPDPACTNIDSPCAQLGWPTFINHVRASGAYFPEHWGPLSIKCAYSGREIYQVGRERFEVKPDSYLILNTGQRYASAIENGEETESLVVFFRPGFVEEVLTSLITPADRLLDEPTRVLGRPVTFYEGLYPHDDIVSPLLHRFRAIPKTEGLTPGWYEEQFHLLLERLLKAHRGVCAEIESLAFKKQSTRIETYHRLRRARDFMDANFQSKIRLPDMSGEAFMASHHFLRMFKQAFHITPHQYLTTKRLDLARELLRHSEMSVTSICLEVGFESLGSFSALFTHRFGVSPVAYRRGSGLRIVLGHDVAA